MSAPRRRVVVTTGVGPSVHDAQPIHDATRRVLHTAYIDDGIWPLVRWLNALPGVATYGSCEGDGEREPYVSFFCCDLTALGIIAHRTANFSRLDASPIAGRGLLFTLRFATPAVRAELCAQLGASA